MRNPSRASSASRKPSLPNAGASDSPLVRITRKLPPTQAFSSFTSDASYAAGPHQPSGGDDSSYAAQSSSARSRLSDMQQSFPSSGFASTFFPLADKDSSCDLLSPSAFGSTRALDTDSPVLPSDDRSPSRTPASEYAISHRIPNPLTPSSADLDAFGVAASNIMIDTHSTMESIPTSFQSLSVLESVNDTAQGHPRRRSSVSLSLSLDLSSEHNSIHRNDRFRQVCNSQYHLPKERPRRTPSPVLSFFQRPGTTKTTSKVTAPYSRSANEHSGKPSKFPALEKVKKFGGRIRKLFKGKASFATNAESEIGVRKHTAVTAVEYTSVSTTLYYLCIILTTFAE